MQKRTTQTRALLEEALLLLLKKKELDAITVSELCKKAGINRTTFYNHYSSPRGVLETMAESYLDDIRRTLEEKNGDVENSVRTVFRYMEAHLLLTRVMLTSPINNTFLEHLFSIPRIADLLEASLSSVTDEREKRAVISFALSGSYKLIKDWVTSSDRISPDEEASLVLGLSRRVCCRDEGKKNRFKDEAVVVPGRIELPSNP